MKQNIRLDRLFKRTFKSGDKLVRDFTDEPDCVNKQDRLLVRKNKFTGGGV
jgi:hypothetical protein